MTTAKTTDKMSTVQRSEFEAFVQTTNTSFDRITQLIREMREEGSHEARELRRDLKELSEKGPDYKAFISAAGVLIAFLFSIGTALSWGILQKFEGLEAVTTEHNAKLDERGQWIGEVTGNLSRVIEDVERLEGDAKNIAVTRYTRSDAEHDFDVLDTTLQREMRLLDDALQREMRMLLDAPLERISRNEKIAETNSSKIEALDGKRFNQSDYDKYVLPAITELQSRLRAVEALATQMGYELGRIGDEQTRRTGHVYDNEP